MTRASRRAKVGRETNSVKGAIVVGEASMCAAYARFAAAWNRGALEEAVGGIYAEQAVVILHDGSQIEGRGAILASYHERFPDPNTMGTIELSLVGFGPGTAPEGAHSVLAWRHYPPSGGERIGRATHIFIETADGARIIRDIDIAPG